MGRKCERCMRGKAQVEVVVVAEGDAQGVEYICLRCQREQAAQEDDDGA